MKSFLEQKESKKKNINSTSYAHQKRYGIQRAFIKTELNNCLKCTDKTSNIIKYPNSWCAIKIVMKEEGVRGFYKGFLLRSLTQSLSAGLSWTVYEMCKKVLTQNTTY